MAKYNVIVTHTVHDEMTVEADSAGEARLKAAELLESIGWDHLTVQEAWEIK